MVFEKKCGGTPWARQGLEGGEAATARSAGAGAIAQPRKARFFPQEIAKQFPAEKRRPEKIVDQTMEVLYEFC
jgi:hypothetical protein